jgi:Cytochrome P460
MKRTWFLVLDRSDNKQVRVIYVNDAAANGAFNNFPYGSILVMETYRAKEDESGAVVLDENGRFQRDTLTGIFVMRKEPGFGAWPPPAAFPSSNTHSCRLTSACRSERP